MRLQYSECVIRNGRIARSACQRLANAKDEMAYLAPQDLRRNRDLKSAQGEIEM